MPAFRRLLLLALPCLLLPAALHAQGRPLEARTYDAYLDQVLFDESYFPVTALWGVIATGLVFLMHLGFATLEAGLSRAKNVVNILYKNVFVTCLGFAAFAVFGFHTMFPGEFNGWWQPGGFIGVPTGDYYDLMTPRYSPFPWWVDYLFQAAIAAKAISIVSGAVAERQKLLSFIIYAVLLTGFAYPVAGAWSWGKGWLYRQGFVDFAGASVVHVFGGFAALAAILLLGPRLGKFAADGTPRPIPGHSMPLATIGMFVLWFGWFGFNGGSLRDAHPELLGLVVTNTALGGALGGLAAMLVTPLILKKPDLSMALNGVLGGLVAVTGSANLILPHHAMAAGALGGVIVIFGVLLLDWLRLDDPIGAIPVHAFAGLWGTLVPAIFASADWKWQVVGAGTYAFTAFTFTIVVLAALRFTIGIRLSPAAERDGADIAEHGQEAYAPEPAREA